MARPSPAGPGRLRKVSLSAGPAGAGASSSACRPGFGRFVANLRADTSDNLEMEFDTVGGNARAVWGIAGADEAVEPILEACNY